ncbi:SMP-30/gluconolactonase/LRE family protein [Roseobacter litoralis]|uniref:SMP-30/gluconolactonase/LRE family protein n=2 Tax=Roseobacter litoralis TaxID=42443 RepID=UPI00249404D1|nr:SMP-30/gluconolactonase/LRE family protein [Roseobacter litoralis]
MLMPEFEVIDPRFKRYVMPNVHMETLYTGTRWAEGPVYFPAAKYLLWSDIPNDRIMRFDEVTGDVSEFAKGCGFHNGHTMDPQGRLVSCEHQGRRVSRVEVNGSVTTLASEYEGKRLNSPNDVVVKSDGSIWFTDPTYGIDSEYEGDRADSEIGASHVYRIDPQSGEVAAVATDFVKPNGLAFSPDESLLYIADTGATHVENGPKHIRVFDVAGDGSLSGGAVFAESTNGLFDGFRVDLDGNIWTSAGDGVHCYAPDGDLIGKILTGEVVANVEFGGIKRNRLFICATTSLRAVYLNTQGCSNIRQRRFRG